jgi:hypothetical protein
MGHPSTTLKDFQRADFIPEDFFRLINQKGYNALWARWIPCPCVDVETWKPKVKCPLCKGRGDRFFDEITARVLLTSIGAQKEFRDFSEFFIGTASLTVYEEDRYIGYRDRFTLTDSWVSFSEYRQRNMDYSSTKEYLQYNPKRVDLICLVDSSGAAYTDLTEGTDFSVDTDGAIVWLSDKAPKNEEFFSVNYLHEQMFQVIDLLNDVRDTQVLAQNIEEYRRLPQRAMVKRSHLLYQTSVRE